VTAFGDEKVGGLDVAVNDTFGVSGVEGVGDFDGEREDGLGFQRSTADLVFQCDAFEEFHSDERLTVLLADIVDGADVGWLRADAACASR
jgi:hypothetical protein